MRRYLIIFLVVGAILSWSISATAVLPTAREVQDLTNKLSQLSTKYTVYMNDVVEEGGVRIPLPASEKAALLNEIKTLFNEFDTGWTNLKNELNP